MTVEPFTKKSGLVMFVSVVARFQSQVRDVSVVFGGGLHDPFLHLRTSSAQEIKFPLSSHATTGCTKIKHGDIEICLTSRWEMIPQTERTSNCRLRDG
jgi:hypothetical protein